MNIGNFAVLILKMNFGYIVSLKEKRKIVRSIKDKVKNKFEVSVSELGDNDIWNHAILGIGIIGNNPQTLNSLINKIVDFIEETFPGYLYDWTFYIEDIKI